MEDAHTTISSYGDFGVSFFAVFDGHGGEAVAKYSGKKLYKKIIDTPAFERGRYRDAIRSGYYGIDEDLLEGNVCIYKKREGKKTMVIKKKRTPSPQIPRLKRITRVVLQ